jgi:hypothetical protein
VSTATDRLVSALLDALDDAREAPDPRTRPSGVVLADALTGELVTTAEHLVRMPDGSWRILQLRAGARGNLRAVAAPTDNAEGQS